MHYNILFLSVGRRVELLKCFKKARSEYDIESKLVAVDISKTAPAIFAADKYYMVPRANESKFIDELIRICREEEIKLVIPTTDTELSVVAINKERIEDEANAKVLISNKNVIDICRNKFNSQKFFEENGFGVPKLITQRDIEKENFSYPLFIKPLDGSSSIDTFKVRNRDELNFFSRYVIKPIIQEFCEGEEYSVDSFLDFESKPITIVPRRRLATRSGEISKGLIVKDRQVIEETKRVLEVLKPIGHITIQCLKTESNIKFIEINPRFGGGAPMSIKAGANSPLNLYRLLRGERLKYNENYIDGLLALRFDEAFYFNRDGSAVDD